MPSLPEGLPQILRKSMAIPIIFIILTGVGRIIPLPKMSVSEMVSFLCQVS